MWACRPSRHDNQPFAFSAPYMRCAFSLGAALFVRGERDPHRRSLKPSRRGGAAPGGRRLSDGDYGDGAEGARLVSMARSTMKRLPPSASASHATAPPWRLAICRTSERPSPQPPDDSARPAGR
jgi:hypothetical protein